MTDFRDLPELAGEAVGGAAIACSDEFFAEKENLLRAHAAEWREHAYTDRGKWMDGWETRRYRPADGVAPGRDSDIHDWCVVRLGLPGAIRGIVVDTAFFRGNFPDTCRIEAATIDAPLDLRALDSAEWFELVPRSPLEGNAQNLFAVGSDARFTHVRLAIYPDGGVARLRVHGEVRARPERHGLVGLTDLAALERGGVVEECSDMFFGARGNLIKPGASRSMADGWETRRRRGPGHEWAIVRLGARGTIDRLELDTSHFKGNAPALCRVEGSRDRADWRVLVESPMQPHTRHLFEDLRRIGDVAYLRLSVFPCGGMARMRAWGTPASEAEAGIRALNALTPLEATSALLRCCGSSAWAAAMTGSRPFEDLAALVRIGERVWFSLGEAEHLEAFGAHPRIGQASIEPARGPSAALRGPAELDLASAWSKGEQASALAAEAAVRAELAEANVRYEATHGFICIICASGRPVASMLADCHARIDRPRGEELRTAAEEQAKIMRLRLIKLIGELG